MADNLPTPMPGDDLKAEKTPGRWLLARSKYRDYLTAVVIFG